MHVLCMPILPFTHVLHATNQIKEELMVLTGSGGSTGRVGWRIVRKMDGGKCYECSTHV